MIIDIKWVKRPDVHGWVLMVLESTTESRIRTDGLVEGFSSCRWREVPKEEFPEPEKEDPG